MWSDRRLGCDRVCERGRLSVHTPERLGALEESLDGAKGDHKCN